VCATCEVGVFESSALAACDGFSWQAKLPFTFCFFISYCPMDGNPIMSGYCIQFLGSLGTIRELPEEQIFCMDCILGFASGDKWHCQLEQRQGYFICLSSSENEVVQLGKSNVWEALLVT
jgi:hypothetical protein